MNTQLAEAWKVYRGACLGRRNALASLATAESQEERAWLALGRLVDASGSPTDKRDILIEARNRLPAEPRPRGAARRAGAWMRRCAIAGAIAVAAIAAGYATTPRETSVASARSDDPAWRVDWRTGLVCPTRDANGEAVTRCAVVR